MQLAVLQELVAHAQEAGAAAQAARAAVFLLLERSPQLEEIAADYLDMMDKLADVTRPDRLPLYRDAFQFMHSFMLKTLNDRRTPDTKLDRPPLGHPRL